MPSASRAKVDADPRTLLAEFSEREMFCRVCQKFKAPKCFADRRRSICKPCEQHKRDLAACKSLNPDNDPRIAELREAVGSTTDTEIDLPGVECWVEQYIAMEGSLEAAMARFLAQLHWAEKHKPGSKTVLDARLAMIKLHLAIEAKKELRERGEQPLGIHDAWEAIQKLIGKYDGQLKLPAIDAPATEVVEEAAE